MALFLLDLSTSVYVIADSDLERESLYGLKGIYLEVALLKPEIEQEGLTRQQLETYVKQKLQVAGIKILTEKEWVKMKGSPALYVNVHIINIPKCYDYKYYTYRVDVELYQDAFLLRNPTIALPVRSWATGCLGAEYRLDVIQAHVESLVDEFVNTYLYMNTK